LSFQLQHKRLHILSIPFPIINGLLCIIVEVLLLLIQKSLSLRGSLLFLQEIFHDGSLFLISLNFLVALKLLVSHSFIFQFVTLLFLELLVSDLPVLSEFFLFLLLHVFLCFSPFHLHSSRPLDSICHFLSSLLLLSELLRCF